MWFPLAKGIPAVGRTLYVSTSTAKTYVARLYDKLGVNSRAQALSVAARAGLLGDDVPLSAR